MRVRGGRTAKSKRRALFILPIWLASLIWMLTWWLNPERIDFAPLYYPLTFALVYEFVLLPSIFLYFVMNAVAPAKRYIRKKYKVAVISLCVPSSESIDIVERQLASMASIKYEHDSWILDEGGDPSIRVLARKYGVKYFTRKDKDKYNQPDAPFKSKTKAGNVNAWLDHVKRYKYDFFVQFDIDHLAKPEYLHKTLGYFKDDSVGWVQAPSVYKNLDKWTSRGAAEQELVLQGPLQMGFYSFSETPFIIGSHCTYRMSAIREIGGFQPTRAEDHLDTMELAACGYKGIFLPEIIAEGDGPETLNTYLAQQFAWAFSMFEVLKGHSPKLLKTLTFKQKLQFLFAQTWYPMWALAYFIMFITPVIALFINQDVARMNQDEFGIHFMPMFMCGFLIWWSARPLMQPQGVMLSWRGMMLHAVRWPIVAIAVLSALLKVKKPYMITPKGSFSQVAPSLHTYRPFLVLSLISTATIIYASNVHGDQMIISQTIFALVNALFMLGICLIDINLRMRQASPRLLPLQKEWLMPSGVVVSLFFLALSSFVVSPLFSSRVVHAVAPSQSNVSVLSSQEIEAMNSLDAWASRIEAVSVKRDSDVPAIGIYQPNPLPKTEGHHINHTFIDWRDSILLAKHLYLNEINGTVSLVTVEPQGVADGNTLLAEIEQGSHDQRLGELFRLIAASKNDVYIRFAHEMELGDLYPWGAQDPGLYIAAYRHAVTLARELGATNAKWVWSPAGNIGIANAYYPGADVVDVVGTTILYDEYFYGIAKPSFYYIASNRMWLNIYGKPVWIVEFGAGKSDPGYQASLINDALENHQLYGFAKLIYLNIPDSNLIGPDYTIPDLALLGNVFREKQQDSDVQAIKTNPPAPVPKVRCMQPDDQGLFAPIPKLTTVTCL